MSRMSLWDRNKNDDYKFFDDNIRELIDVGGVEVLVHKYLGIKTPTTSDDATLPVADPNKQGELQIQDMLFLENRDRKYDKDLYILKTVYNIQDTEYNMAQIGLFIDADILYFEFHINECLEKIGRKLMPGDVLEFPHLRDDALLDESLPATNKFYVILDVTRSADGWSPMWRPHLYRVKAKPMSDSQEFNDILDGEIDDDGTKLRDVISDYNDLIGISDILLEQAESDVKLRNFETIHFYVVPGDEDGDQYPWIFAGDGNPPNGAELAITGDRFPSSDNVVEGAWFLHTGYDPYVLFQRVNGKWKRKEADYRKKWQAAHRILESFINNNNQTEINGTIMDQKIYLSKAVKPKEDF